jgi:response regulator of citrate/malate metabolism
VIRVLIVEDRPVAAEAHAAYVERISGFEVAGTARTGTEALRLLGKTEIDLVLLDIYLPDMHGLDVVRSMRASGHAADVIAVTVARDVSVIRAAVSYGILFYLIKPFTFRTFQDKFERYRDYHNRITGTDQVFTQHSVDDLLTALRPGSTDLPKGMSRESLEGVVATLGNAAGALSATEVAGRVGASRVTARRYLEYLVDNGLALRHARYGTAGRPEVEYRWRPPPRDRDHDVQRSPKPADDPLAPKD